MAHTIESKPKAKQASSKQKAAIGVTTTRLYLCVTLQLENVELQQRTGVCSSRIVWLFRVVNTSMANQRIEVVTSDNSIEGSMCHAIIEALNVNGVAIEMIDVNSFVGRRLQATITHDEQGFAILRSVEIAR